MKTTVSDKGAACPLDKVNRQFRTPEPNRLWVADFTYVATWAGFVYVAFVIDAFARRIVGWRVSRTAHATFVLDALEQAIHARRPARGTGLVHHRDHGVQGEFNRSSQHSGIGGCYDGTQTAVGSVWTEQVAFARSTGLGAARGDRSRPSNTPPWNG